MTTTVDTVASVEVRISDLTVVYKTPEGELPAVSAIDLTLPAGTITGLVGESGSGKSTLALSLLNAVQPPGRIRDGRVEIEGVGDVVGLKGEKLRRARGGQVGYVFQAAQNSLNPLKPVGKQVLDLGRSHGVDDLRGLIADARDLLGRMGLDGARVLDSYQHELSGGMRQRVGIMLALVLNAHVVVLDEPTTALDMITQANILEIVREIHAERGLTTLVITHDMGVVAEVADAVAVMYGGKIVEHGPVRDVLSAPQHPYTRALTQAIPRLTGDITEARALPGRPPTLTTVPRKGCVFVERCPIRMDVCADVAPEMITHLGHRVACHAVESTSQPVEPAETTRPLVEPVETTSPLVEPVETTPPPAEPTTPLVEPVETTQASNPNGDLDELDQREERLNQRTEDDDD